MRVIILTVKSYLHLNINKTLFKVKLKLIESEFKVNLKLIESMLYKIVL